MFYSVPLHAYLETPAIRTSENNGNQCNDSPQQTKADNKAKHLYMERDLDGRS